MLEVLDVVIRIVWFAVFVLLIIAESLFCIQLHSLVNLHKKYKKEYALASNNGHNGHRGRLMKDIKADLNRLKVLIISWTCIVIATAYAILYCFLTHIIQ